jgi:hypothetical protein
MDEASQKPPKKPRDWSVYIATRSRPVDVDKLYARLFTVLLRETEGLMKRSHKKQLLSDDDSTRLVAYLKLIKELRKIDEDSGAKLSDEELADLAAKEKK